MGNARSSPEFKDVIVAVHGIGQQSRYSTVRSVATRLAASKTLLAGKPGQVRPVAPQPLGYFHSEVRGITSVTLLDDAAFLGDTPLASTGFAEVFWADIPEQAVAEGSTLEELARSMGIDPAKLAATVEKYNTSDADGTPAAGPPMRGQRPQLRSPPFYALGPVRNYINFTDGGLAVNEHLQVLDAQGRAIPGLYAAGASGQGGLLLKGHGHHLGWAFTSGRLAGEYAARSLPDLAPTNS